MEFVYRIVCYGQYV